jgi:hypothetical protein
MPAFNGKQPAYSHQRFVRQRARRAVLALVESHILRLTGLKQAASSTRSPSYSVWNPANASACNMRRRAACPTQSVSVARARSTPRARAKIRRSLPRFSGRGNGALEQQLRLAELFAGAAEFHAA